jgi:hypothetical protein
MTQAASRTRSSTALRRVEAYRKRFGAGHIYLACYATVPLALTPDLLYRLWANFQRDPQGEWLEIPWIAVSDLLLSNLCEEVGEELYEMEDGVREVLLKELRSLGETRLKEVAEFVLAYVEPQLNNPDLDTRDLAEVQQWRSLAYIEPEMAARAIAQRLARLDHGDKSEWLRMARVVEPLAEPLVAFGHLVDYTRGMAAFVRGQMAEAKDQLQEALGGNREVEVSGVKLPLPESLREALQPELPAVESKLSWVDLLLRNRRWVGAGAGLLVMVGSGVYWWRSQNTSDNSTSVILPSSVTSPSSISGSTTCPSSDVLQQQLSQGNSVELTFQVKPSGSQIEVTSDEMKSVSSVLKVRAQGVGYPIEIKQDNMKQEIKALASNVKNGAEVCKSLTTSNISLEFREQKPGTEAQFIAESAVIRSLREERKVLENGKNKDAIIKNQQATARSSEAIQKLFQPSQISNNNIVDAFPVNDDQSSWSITINFDKIGSEKFTLLTKNLAGTGRAIGIFLDNVLISSPVVSVEFAQTGIQGGHAVITGNFDANSARELSAQLQSGALIKALELVEVKTIK